MMEQVDPSSATPSRRTRTQHPEVIVALQGTLDTFALPDVLRLLATTRKTGRLLVHGNRGDGNVWVDAGSVIAASASKLAPGSSSGDVVFELLRHTEGAFTFEAGSTPPEAGAPAEVEPLLVQAEAQLFEWRQIETVVPSMEAWVSLAPELPGAEAVIDAGRWRTIVAIGSGTTVAVIGETLGLAEVPVCRIVKELVELGYGTVTAAAPVAVVAAPPTVETVDVGAFAERPASPGLDLSIDLGPFADDLSAPSASPILNGVDAFSIDIPGVNPILANEPPLPPPPTAPLPPPPVLADVPGARHDDEPLEADEVARQLASLSPKAARAVAAAAKAETAEERDAALAEVTGEDDEPINRGLLLKFLSSVRS